MALKDNLVSVWSMPSGIDIVGTNNLTGNLPNSASGLFSETAGNFIDANNDALTIADNSGISGGNFNFSMGAWVRLSSTLTAQNKALFSKWRELDNAREYRLHYQQSNGVFYFQASPNGINSVTASTASFGSGVSNNSTWYYVYAYHDATNDKIGVSINDGPRYETTYPSGVANGDAPFGIGCENFYGNYFLRMDGYIQQPAFWRGVKTTDEISQIYNGGFGLAYSAWDVPVSNEAIYSTIISSNSVKNGGSSVYINRFNHATISPTRNFNNLDSQDAIIIDRFDDPTYYKT